ncbi:MAG TPA: hypothetical protein VGB83_00150 [Actinomycetota bacterium]
MSFEEELKGSLTRHAALAEHSVMDWPRVSGHIRRTSRARTLASLPLALALAAASVAGARMIDRAPSSLVAGGGPVDSFVYTVRRQNPEKDRLLASMRVEVDRSASYRRFVNELDVEALPDLPGLEAPVAAGDAPPSGVPLRMPTELVVAGDVVYARVKPEAAIEWIAAPYTGPAPPPHFQVGLEPDHEYGSAAFDWGSHAGFDPATMRAALEQDGSLEALGAATVDGRAVTKNRFHLDRDRAVEARLASLPDDQRLRHLIDFLRHELDAQQAWPEDAEAEVAESEEPRRRLAIEAYVAEHLEELIEVLGGRDYVDPLAADWTRRAVAEAVGEDYDMDLLVWIDDEDLVWRMVEDRRPLGGCSDADKDFCEPPWVDITTTELVSVGDPVSTAVPDERSVRYVDSVPTGWMGA